MMVGNDGPEVVAPLSKLKNLLSQMQNTYKPGIPSDYVHSRPAKPPRNYRVLLYPVLAILLTLQWLLVLIQNLAEVGANAFEEICLALSEYIKPNAQAKPTNPPAGESGTERI